MIRAFFADFYGTLVHEDGAVIKRITEIIRNTGNAGDAGVVVDFICINDLAAADKILFQAHI